MIVNPVRFASSANFGKEVTVSYKNNSPYGANAALATPSGITSVSIVYSGTITMYVGYPLSVSLYGANTATAEKGFAGNLNGQLVAIPFEDGASFVFG